MYRCKECNTEYETKPDYCNCGNDEFEFVGADNNLTVDTKSDSVKVDLDKNVQVNVPPKTKPQPAPQINYNKPQTVSVKRLSVDPASLTIFCLCLLLSLYIVFFAWNPKESDIATENTKQETTVSKNIPSVDKIWNNELPKVQQKKEEAQKPQEHLIQQIFPKQTETKTTTVQPQKTVAPLKKTTQPTKAATTNVSKAKTTTQQAKQEQQKNTAEQLAKQKAEQERAAAEATMIKKLQAEQTKKKAEEKAKQEKAAKEELTNYKANLRNAIGRKVDFTRVIGDGSCTVSFKIDSNGKLINRSFTKQSTNNTLNDEVYAAVMSTPTFNPPPSGYKGETLNLNIGFYNGNFEISLP